jgi:hypothetical protein
MKARRLFCLVPLVLLVWIAASGAGDGPDAAPALSGEPLPPNVLLDVSGDLIIAGLSQDVSITRPVRRQIRRMTAEGTAEAHARMTVRLVPTCGTWMMDAVLHGSGTAYVDGYRPHMVLHAQGEIPHRACKRLFIDIDGVHGLPSVVEPHPDIHLVGVDTPCHGPVLEHVLMGIFPLIKPRVDARVTPMARDQMQRGIDRDAAREIDDTTEEYFREVRRPLEQAGLFPSDVRFTTTATHLHACGRLGGPDRPGPTTPPPGPTDDPDVVLRIHESYANNALADTFGGKTVSGEDFKQETRFLLGPFGRDLTLQPDSARWSITFDEKEPLTAAFADHRVTLTFRISGYRMGEKRYRGLHVVVRYRLRPTASGAKATREGDVEVLPSPGRRLDLAELIVVALVKQRLAEMFRQELVLEQPRIPRKLRPAGPLRTTQADAVDGWVLLAWRMQSKGP